MGDGGHWESSEELYCTFTLFFSYKFHLVLVLQVNVWLIVPRDDYHIFFLFRYMYTVSLIKRWRLFPSTCIWVGFVICQDEWNVAVLRVTPEPSEILSFHFLALGTFLNPATMLLEGPWRSKACAFQPEPTASWVSEAWVFQPHQASRRLYHQNNK